MPPKKTPTSSLPAIELLVKRVFYRTLARIQKIRSGGVSPETSTKRCSPATRLPLEVVKIIIAYLIYDTRSLRACTLTCYSWYIAAVPHLHHTLITTIGSLGDKHFRWPNPIRHMHTLGLLPLVKEIRIHGRNRRRFSPERFNYSILRQFSALTRVRKLDIRYLDIPSFMPRIQRYFSHFSPTVRSLVLRDPDGTRREILYFIGLFRNLQDLELIYSSSSHLERPAGDPALIPVFVPPLRGWLGLERFNVVGFLKDMIDLFGGIRFRWMRLYEVYGMQPLLNACAKTLVSVVFNPTDPLAKSSPQDFDLSRNKSLRALQIPWFPIDSSTDASKFFKHVLSTITSSVFFQITVYYGNDYFSGIETWHQDWPLIRQLSQAERAKEVSRHRRMFAVFREAYKVRDFRLRLCVNIWGSAGEEPVRILEDAIAEEKAKNGFRDFRYCPCVVYNPQRSCF